MPTEYYKRYVVISDHSHWSDVAGIVAIQSRIEEFARRDLFDRRRDKQFRCASIMVGVLAFMVVSLGCALAYVLVGR